MEVILMLFLVIIVVVVLSRNAATREALERLTGTIHTLTREIHSLREEITTLKAPPAAQAPAAEKAPEPAPPQAPPVYRRPAPVPEPPPRLQPQPAIPSPPERPQPQRQAAPPQPQQPEESWFDRWMRNNPDLEKFIGENLVNKIGIAVLVLGIAFFVKYAIDKDWIGEGGRVAIGLLCGALLTGIAHYLRNSYRSFSSVLAGGGIAVFYFTIAFAFHQYQLLSQTAAFLLMVVITAFAVALSLLYNKLELAVIATIGGFLTPFLVSTGQGNYIVLFTYLAVLNAGLLSLSYFKRWPLINGISLAFTLLIFGGWMVTSIPGPNLSYPLALLFATLFYLIFLGMNTLNPIRTGQAFRAYDFTQLLVLTGAYFAAGMALLHYVQDGRYQGLFTLAAGLVNLSLAWYFFKHKGADRNLLYLLIGLTLTFLSLAIPVQLQGHAITLFWSAEFVLLYWLYQRSGIALFRYSAALMSVLTLVSLLMDWQQAAAASPYPLAVLYTNVRGGVTNLVAAAAFAAWAFLLQKDPPERTYAGPLPHRWVLVGAAGVSVVLLYLTVVFGINLYFRALPTYEVPNAAHRLVSALFAGALLLWAQKRRGVLPPVQQLAVLALFFGYYLFSTPLATSLRNGVLAGTWPGLHLAVHWAAAALALALLFGAVGLVRRGQVSLRPYQQVLIWALCGVAVLLCSLEARHVFVVAAHGRLPVAEGDRQYAKAGLTIVWALCSFALMWLGMRHKNKTLRIVSLSLFSLALVKLFFADLRGISEGGKILAFILLGVLLLTISFMYQKLKKIIIEDAKE
ncbi:DUF2339 domain-containing protein [Paraflavisolibacter sp. H34]|uniref:DUF2339 domain-containing protein n=1 Tax=Huijunlia imazamoxiresistens TaxID=3127457 RepID=UPI003016FECD